MPEDARRQRLPPATSRDPSQPRRREAPRVAEAVTLLRALGNSAAAHRLQAPDAAARAAGSPPAAALERPASNQAAARMLRSLAPAPAPAREAPAEDPSAVEVGAPTHGRTPALQLAAADGPRDPDTGATRGSIHALARLGVDGPGSPLPHLSTLQRAFGEHDLSRVRAHVDPGACAAIGARAYTLGSHVAFASATPDLRVAAHEAAHIVQQRAGVQLYGGVGERGDVYERHADAVADAVTRGASAEALLDRGVGPGAPASPEDAPVQRLIYDSRGKYIPNLDAAAFLRRTGFKRATVARVIKAYGRAGKYTLGEAIAHARLIEAKAPPRLLKERERRPGKAPKPKTEPLVDDTTDTTDTTDITEAVDPPEPVKPTPERPNVPYSDIPRGTPADVKSFLAKAYARRLDNSQVDYEPEVKQWEDTPRLTALAATDGKVPLLYRGFMAMPQAARDAVLEGESLSGMARTARSTNPDYDLASARAAFNATYITDETAETTQRQEKFARLKAAVASHKGSGHSTSNFVGTSANPDYVLNWFQPSLSTDFDAFSIAVVVVPKDTDLVFRSVDLLDRAGCGTKIDDKTGEIIDWESEYLFAGGFSADQIVAYITVKYRKIPKPIAQDIFANDTSLTRLIDARKAAAGGGYVSDRSGDAKAKYHFALEHAAKIVELRADLARKKHTAATAKGMPAIFARKKVEEIESELLLAEQELPPGFSPEGEADLKTLAELRTAEVDLAKSEAKGVKGAGILILGGRIATLRRKLKVPSSFTTISPQERAALREPTTTTAPVDKTAYKNRGDVVYRREKRLTGGIHATYIMRREGDDQRFVWKPEERAEMRQAESGGSSLAAAIVGADLSPVAVDTELFNPGTQTWEAGTLQPFLRSNAKETQAMSRRDVGYKYSPTQTAQLLAHMIADWVIANYDNHHDQFLVGEDDSIIGLDKGQALKFTYEGDATALDGRIAALATESLKDSTFVVDATYPNTERKPAAEAFFAITRDLVARIKGDELKVDWEEPHLVQAIDFASKLQPSQVEEHLGALARGRFAGKEEALYAALAARANKIKAQLKALFPKTVLPKSLGGDLE